LDDELFKPLKNVITPTVGMNRHHYFSGELVVFEASIISKVDFNFAFFKINFSLFMGLSLTLYLSPFQHLPVSVKYNTSEKSTSK
jgi:hypothetical protein